MMIEIEFEYLVKVYNNGDREWYLNDKYHREDGPAVEWVNGTRAWFLNGKLHREDGPAIEYANGDREWYFNGQLHREDGPAVERANGNCFWYLNGVRMKKFIARSKVESCDSKVVEIDGKRYKLTLVE